MTRLRFFVSTLLLLHLIALVWVAWGLPIGPHEAKLYFAQHNVVSTLMHWGTRYLPPLGFLNIRIPFLLLHLVNLYLFYRLSRLFLKDERSLYTSFIIFLLLPGIVSSAILASSTGLILVIYQAFLILYLTKRKIAAYLVLPFFLLVDKSCVVFYFALVTYALWRRETPLLVVAALLFGMALSMYGVEMHGKPVNYFVDTIALYAAIFSPLVFLYFFYAMYRILLKGEKNIIWHISFTILILSLTISLRQRIPIEDFAPYVIVAIPLMVRLFFQSFRVRLPQFRKKYFYLATIVFLTLLLNTVVLLFHKPLFLVLKNPKRHFAAPFYLPYWCALELKKMGIHEIEIDKKNKIYQFKYYGISANGKRLLQKRPNEASESVTIRYRNRPIDVCHVSKINR